MAQIAAAKRPKDALIRVAGETTSGMGPHLFEKFSNTFGQMVSQA